MNWLIDKLDYTFDFIIDIFKEILTTKKSDIWAEIIAKSNRAIELG